MWYELDRLEVDTGYLRSCGYGKAIKPPEPHSPSWYKILPYRLVSEIK